MSNNNEHDLRGARVITAGWLDDGLWRIVYELRGGQVAVHDYRTNAEAKAIAA